MSDKVTERPYLNFDLQIEGTGTAYSVRVLDSPAGQAAANEITLPFSELELENFLLRIGHRSRRTRRLESRDLDGVREFGTKLFQATMSGDVGGAYRASSSWADREGAGLRIRLRLSAAPGLIHIPWEFLFDPLERRFIALSVDSPIVRFLDVPGTTRPFTLVPPVRVLVVIASPSDFQPLEVELEWARLKEAVKDIEASGQVVLERLTRPTLGELQRALRRTYHVLHFIGHGGFDGKNQDGMLIFEDENGRGAEVSATYISTLLHDADSLRLAVLNACDGAASSRTDQFAGVAQSLLHQGVPAVVAMQFEITDDAAITFAREFYGAFADGYSVEAATVEARKSIFALQNDSEWATPVLYLRSGAGPLFRLSPDASVPAGEPPPVPPAEAVPPDEARTPPAAPTRTAAPASASVSTPAPSEPASASMSTPAPSEPASASVSAPAPSEPASASISTPAPSEPAPPAVAPARTEPEVAAPAGRGPVVPQPARRPVQPRKDDEPSRRRGPFKHDPGRLSGGVKALVALGLIGAIAAIIATLAAMAGGGGGGGGGDDDDGAPGGGDVPFQSFAGIWYTNFAQMELQEADGQVTGQYVGYLPNAELEELAGSRDGNGLAGSFGGLPNNRFVFVRETDEHHFDGYWLDPGGRPHEWCGTRDSATLEDGCGYSGTWNVRGLPEAIGLNGDTIEIEQNADTAIATFELRGGREAQLAGAFDATTLARVSGFLYLDASSYRLTWLVSDEAEWDSFQGTWDSSLGGSGNWCGWRGAAPPPC